MKKTIHSVAFFCVCLALLSCAGKHSSSPARFELTLLSDQIKREIRKVSKSIVGINTHIRYEIYQYDYLQRNGRLVRDPNSPLRYKLDAKNGDSGIIVTNDKKTLSGGGLVIHIGHPESRYAILTSSHLVAPDDTTDIYYLDENGNATDILFTRYVIKGLSISVRGPSNWGAEATLIADDPVNDLAIISVETENSLGREFPNEIGYHLDLDWGDWVFLFGYPKGIKQMTGGWISRAPYSNTLAVDAVVRFGYSGGPVFAISHDAKLVFVGLIKSVPSGAMDYIAPDASLPMGYRLTQEEVENLIVKREMLVEYGTAYFVNPKTLKKFFRAGRAILANSGIRLDPKYYGK